MSSQHPSSLSAIVARHGLIAGGIMGSMFLVTYPWRDQIGFGWLGMAIGYAAMVLGFLMIHVGVRTYRDSVAGGRVSFGQALKVGLLIALVATVVYIVIWELVYFLLLPDFMVKYGEYAVQQAQRAGQSAAQIDTLRTQMTEFAAAYRDPLVVAAYTFLEPLPVAVPFALVSAWLASRHTANTSAPLARVTS